MARKVVSNPQPLQRFRRWPFFVQPFPAQALLNAPGNLAGTISPTPENAPRNPQVKEPR